MRKTCSSAATATRLEGAPVDRPDDLADHRDAVLLGREVIRGFGEEEFDDVAAIAARDPDAVDARVSGERGGEALLGGAGGGEVAHVRSVAPRASRTAAIGLP
jgi:hypothetical protein